MNIKYYLITLLLTISTGCGEDLVFTRQLQDSQSITGAKKETITVTAMDVGEGDATIIMDGDQNAILIDSGPEGSGKEKILPYLRQKNIKLKAILITHYHKDHIGGLGEILCGEDGIIGTGDDMTPTDGLWDRGGENEPSDTEYQVYKQVVSKFRHTVYSGLIINIGGADLEIVAVNGDIKDSDKIALEPFDENSASAVLLLTHNEVKFLFEGDITGGGGTPPYQTIDLETSIGKVVGKIDVLRVSHHGSSTSTNENLLTMTRPKTAVISVGENSFGHPNPSTIERLQKFNVEIYSTQTSQNIEFFSDGEDYSVKTEK